MISLSQKSESSTASGNMKALVRAAALKRAQAEEKSYEPGTPGYMKSLVNNSILKSKQKELANQNAAQLINNTVIPSQNAGEDIAAGQEINNNNISKSLDNKAAPVPTVKPVVTPISTVINGNKPPIPAPLTVEQQAARLSKGDNYPTVADINRNSEESKKEAGYAVAINDTKNKLAPLIKRRDELSALATTMNDSLVPAEAEKYQKELNAVNAEITPVSAALKKQQDEYDTYQNGKKAASLSAVKQNADYDTVISSVDGSKIEVKPFDKYHLEKQQAKRALDPVYAAGFKATDAPLTDLGYSSVDYINDDEKNTLKYYVGKNDWENVKSYLDTISPALNDRKRKADTAQIEANTKSGAGGVITNIALNIAGSLISPAAYLDIFGKTVKEKVTGKYEPVDLNSAAYAGVNITNDTTKSLSQSAYDSVKKGTGSALWADIASKATGIGLSVLQNAARTPLAMINEPVSLLTMSTGAAGSTAAGAVQSGGTKAQALTFGTMAGAVEYLTEKVSLDGLLDIIHDNGKAAAKDMVIKTLSSKLLGMGRQLTTEASEEVVSEIADNIISQAVMGDKSDYEQYVKYLMKNSGYSESDARKAATSQFYVANVIWAGIGGGVSGGIMGGVVTAWNSVSLNNYDSATGKENRKNAPSIIQTALGNSSDTDSYKLAKQLSTKKSVSDSELGKLIRYNNHAAANTARTQYLSANGESDAQNVSNIIGSLINGDSITNKQAEAIIASPAALSYLKGATGKDFDNTATMAVQRREIKEIMGGVSVLENVTLKATALAHEVAVSEQNGNKEAADGLRSEAQNTITETIDTVRNSASSIAEKKPIIDKLIATLKAIKQPITVQPVQTAAEAQTTVPSQTVTETQNAPQTVAETPSTTAETVKPIAQETPAAPTQTVAEQFAVKLTLDTQKVTVKAKKAAAVITELRNAGKTAEADTAFSRIRKETGDLISRIRNSSIADDVKKQLIDGIRSENQNITAAYKAVSKPAQPVNTTAEKAPVRQSVKDTKSVLTTPTDTTVDNTPKEVYNKGENGIEEKRRGVVYTNDNKAIDFHYAVVSADELTTSNNEDMSVNEKYPAELQPRSRDRAASSVQIKSIANNLNPERLAESKNVQDGAPIVGIDNVVESGNGRVLSIRAAMQSNPEKAKAYTEYLKANAEKYGLNPNDITEKSILVRVRDTEVNRSEFARSANESTVSSMSPSETAASDAKKMSDDVLGLFVPNESADINTTANHDFIVAFVNNVIPETERNSYVDASGALSQNGLSRVRNAVFHKAYGDISLTNAISESLDDEIKNVTKALLNAAPRVALIKSGISNGNLYDLDFSTDLVQAATLYNKLHKEKTSVSEFLSQTRMFDEYSDIVKSIAQIFEDNKRSARGITNRVIDALKAVEALGDPNQQTMFDNTAITKGDILNATDREEQLTFGETVQVEGKRSESDKVHTGENQGAREKAPGKETVKASKGGTDLWDSPSAPGELTQTADRYFNDLVRTLATPRGITVSVDDILGEESEYLFSDGSVASPFYSKLAREIDTAKQDKFATSGLVNYLLGKGVKVDEMKWLGLADFLEGKKSVSKAELLDYLKANDLRVEEKTPSRTLTNTKFIEYTLNKGINSNNYRELLFTLPNSSGSFQSQHWSENNVIAHTRLQDMTDKDGKKVLFVEEVQSDWHEKGREKGYKSDYADWNSKENIESRRAFDRSLHEMVDRNGDFGFDNAADALREIRTNKAFVDSFEVESEADRQLAIEAYNENERRMAHKNALPEAPFKTTWHEFVLKRILRMAAEGGYDKVAWTTGDMQAERYNLSAQIDHITARPEEDGDRIEVETWQPDKDFNVDLTGYYTDKELVETFGKDLGSRIANGVAEKGGEIVISGEGLKIGGEGMKNFYDIGGKSSQNIPRFLQKYTRPWGTNVGMTTLSTGEEVPSVNITDKMRSSVLYEGQPMFSIGTDKSIDAERDALVENAIKASRDFDTARSKRNELESTDEYEALIDRRSAARKSGDVNEYIKVKQLIEEWEKSPEYKEAQSQYDKYKKILEEASKAVDDYDAQEYNRKAKKSGLNPADYRRSEAVKTFGYTPYFYDAGYMLPNGKMLNFSGEKGKHYGTRGEDHRSISSIFNEKFEDNSGTTEMIKFMGEGNIRVMAESPGLDISTIAEPTTQQYATIRAFVRGSVPKQGQFSVDFSDADGKVTDSIFYDYKVSAEKVVNDIKYFYQNGKVPPVSDIQQFRYSATDNDSPNAYFDPDTKTIHILKDASKTPTVLLGHELFHSLSADDQAKLAFFFRENTDERTDLFKTFKDERTATYSALYAKHGREFTEKDFWNEYAAENCETLFTDESYIRKLAQKSPSLAQKILDWIRDLWNRLTGSDTFTRSRATNAGNLSYDALIKAEKMYADALGVKSWNLNTSGKKAVSLSDISASFKSITGVPWNIGKVNVRNASGIYKVQPETMRTKTALDIPTAAHEQGHHFDKKFGFSKDTEADYMKELVKLYGDELSKKNYKPAEIPGESVAEFFREFITNSKAASDKAPLFSEHVYNTLSETQRNDLMYLSDMFSTYLKSGLVSRYKASERTDKYIGSWNVSGTGRTITALKESYKPILHDWHMIWTSRIFDRFAAIKDAEMRIAKNAGAEPNIDIYKKVSLLSRVDNIAYQAIAGTQVYGLDLNPLGIQSLAGVTSEYFHTKADEENYREYHKQKRAQTLAKRGIRTYADEELQKPENIQADINRLEGENPWLPKALADVTDWQRIVGQEFLVNSGNVSQELYDRLWEQDPYYIPFYRVMDSSMPGSGIAKKGIVNQPNVIKRMKGSGRDTKNVLDNLGVSVANIIKAGMRNNTANDLAKLMDNNEGTGIFMEQIPPSKVKTVVGTEGILGKIEDLLSDKTKMTELGLDDGDAAFDLISEAVGDSITSWRTSDRQKNNVVRVMRDGKPVYYEVHDENVFSAITEMTPVQMAGALGAIINTAGKLTQQLKVLTTGISPIFMVRNLGKDYGQAFIASTTTNNPASYTGQVLSAAGNIIRNSDVYKNYVDAGGGYTGMVTEGSRKMRSALNAVKTGGMDGNFVTKTFRKYGAGLEALGRVIDISDQVMRLPEYKRVKAAGGSEVEAQYAAARVSVDFSVGGTWTKQIDKIIPYFNAAITSMYQRYSEHTTAPISGGTNKIIATNLKHLGYGILSVALMSLFNYILAPKLFKEDKDKVKEALDNESNYTKNNYWLYYAGNGQFKKIAKSQSDDFVFSFMQRILDTKFAGETDAFYKFGDYVNNVLLPPHNVIMLGNFIDLATNKSWNGSPIIPLALKTADHRLQYNEKSTTLAMAIGDKFNISPMQIDYVIDQNLGIIGDMISGVFSQQKENLITGAIKGFTDAFSSDSVYSTDIVSIFYDKKAEYDTSTKSYKATDGKDDRYKLSDVYNAEKYGKYADLYSTVKKHINAAPDEESKRAMRYTINSIIDDVNHSGMTELDKQVLNIADKAGVPVSDIAPYIGVPDKITITLNQKDENGDKIKRDLVLDYNDTIEYNKYVASMFADDYAQLFVQFKENNADPSTAAEVLKHYKDEITKSAKTEIAKIILAREDGME